MARLVAFGCSLTYGHGLEDCFVPPVHPGPKHSELAWPSIVATKCNLQLVNVSQCGASFREICHTVLNFDFKKDDKVVVLWTNLYRWCKISPEGIKDRYGLWQEGPIVDNLAEHWSEEYDLVVTASHCINLVYYHLRQHNIKHIQILSGSGIKPDFKWDFKKLKWNFAKLEDYDFSVRMKYPKALDGGHPGLEAHREFAKLVVKSIDKLS